MLSRISFFILSAMLVALPLLVHANPEPHVLEKQTRLYIERFPEFRFIKSWAQKNNLDAYLFGGTATTVAQTVRRSLLNGESQPTQNASDVVLGSVFNSLQDLDIVINGNDDQVNALESELMRRFPHFQPADISDTAKAKTTWEVRPLNQPLVNHKHPKEALRNNPDFLNRNNDSFSTGLIEITENGKIMFRDLHDWNNPNSVFFESVRKNQLRFLRSSRHNTTASARIGMNPEILSAIRYLIKATQFEAELDRNDLQEVQKIISKSIPLREQSIYPQKWIERNGKKLVQGSKSLSRTMELIKNIGLTDYILGTQKKSFLGSMMGPKSLPIKAHSLGESLLKTPLAFRTKLTAEDGLTVYYKFKDIKDYERVYRTGRLNLFNEDGKNGITITTLKPQSLWTVEMKLSPHASAEFDYQNLGNGKFLLLNSGAVEIDRQSLVPTAEKLLSLSDIRVSDLRTPIVLELTRIVNATNPKVSNELSSLYEKFNERLSANEARLDEILVAAGLITTNSFKETQKLISKQTTLDWLKAIIGVDHLRQLPWLENKIYTKKLAALDARGLVEYTSKLRDPNKSLTETELQALYKAIVSTQNFEASHLFARYGIVRLPIDEQIRTIHELMNNPDFKADEETYFLITKYVLPNFPISAIEFIKDFAVMADHFSFEKTLQGLQKYVATEERFQPYARELAGNGLSCQKLFSLAK